MNWNGLAELVALLILGIIAVTAMQELGVHGKEIPLAIGSGIAGYLTKAAVNIVRK